MNDYISGYERSRKALGSGLQRYMIKLYGHVSLALLLTAVGAVATLTFAPLSRLIFKFDFLGNFVGYTGLGIVIAFAPFAISIYLSANFFKLSFSRSRLILAIYAILTGCSLASLAFYYTIDSLHKTFLITAVTFGCMSMYGYSTRRDLTSIGSFCVMAIWGLIISAVVNIFLRSDAVNFVTSFVGVVVFTLFVAYNTQKLKELYYEVQDTDLAEKAALMGAFSLYINFLNLFLYLLRFFGERKRK
ncbi:MAG: Bax inhibitor-1/YccA family protein [Amoebophilaceae bacterium]|nr:Bax inhibitor-1/YccA family protein [Amoebophilaceae bacterium]